MKPQQIPNTLTFLRLALVFPLVLALYHRHYETAFYCLLVAGVSDALDGYLARAFDWSSRLGSMIDPLADKLLLITAFAGLALLGDIPFWLLVLVISRDMTLIIGSLILHRLIGPYEFSPTMISKINTALQILFIGLVLFNLSFHVMPALWIDIIIGIVTVTTSLSFIDYVWCWGTRAFMQNKGANG